MSKWKYWEEQHQQSSSSSKKPRIRFGIGIRRIRNARESESNSPPTTPENFSDKTIDELPNEIMEMIFGYLTHTEQLTSRLVCKDWNDEISVLLAKSSYFVLNSEQNHQLLLDSEVQWMNIKITTGLTYKLPTKLKNRINTLQLELFESNMKSCLKLVTEFPNVTTLDICMLGDFAPISSEIMKSTQYDEFHNILGKLRSFLLKFPFNNYNALNQFLCELRYAIVSLSQFYIEEHRPTEEESELDIVQTHRHGRPIPLTISDMYKIISTSAGALKNLQIFFYSATIRSKLYSELVTKLCTLNNLNLETALLHHGPNQVCTEQDFLIYQTFLKGQISLKDATLPWCPKTSICQQFVLYLPRRIKSLRRVRQEHITGQFLMNFPNLKFVSVVSEMRREIFSQVDDRCTNVRRLHVHLESDRGANVGDGAPRLLTRVAIVFVNLVELKILGNNSTVLAYADLRFIIEEFKQLRNLEINPCGGIGDDAITGIDFEYCEGLMRTRRLYLCPDLIVPTEERFGSPISSMENLESLTLLGTSISDVGLYFGFRFGSRLKKLRLGSKSKNVTDWGLNWLGKHSPGLEVLEGTFSRKRISTLGTETLRSHLSMIESTKKFKFVTLRTSRY